MSLSASDLNGFFLHRQCYKLSPGLSKTPLLPCDDSLHSQTSGEKHLFIGWQSTGAIVILCSFLKKIKDKNVNVKLNRSEEGKKSRVILVKEDFP